MKDLESPLKEEVVELCQKAVDMQDEERYHASNRELAKVYELLPEPKAEWKAYSWLLSNIGDNHFEQKEYAEAYAKFEEVFEGDSEAKENPYLLLRRGQCAVELEKAEEAAELLAKALELGGKELFEDEHSKFFKIAKQKDNA